MYCSCVFISNPVICIGLTVLELVGRLGFHHTKQSIHKASKA
jgi:hypothetical protein